MKNKIPFLCFVDNTGFWEAGLDEATCNYFLMPCGKHCGHHTEKQKEKRRNFLDNLNKND